MDTYTPKYEISKNCLYVADGTVILKNRVVAMFDSKIRKVNQMVQKLRFDNKILDVTNNSTRRSVLLLEDGSAILSCFPLKELVDQFGG